MRRINPTRSVVNPTSFSASIIVIAMLVAAVGTVGLAAESNTLQALTHSSTILGVSKGMNVLLPVDYDPSTRYPTIYVLHGATGNYQSWVRGSNIREYALKYQVILVFPDGNPYGWYLDSPLEPNSQYESYIIKELIPYIDSQYSTIAEASGRAIVGLSMGGHGAITLAFKHPDQFASTSSLSGILDITTHPSQWEIANRLGPLATNRSKWEANSAVYLASSVPADTHLRILFDSGTGDPHAIYDNRALHAKLTELGIPHTYREYPGQHNWAYWDAHIDEHLQFHMSAFAEAAAAQQ